jgi:hypothetical protein
MALFTNQLFSNPTAFRNPTGFGMSSVAPMPSISPISGQPIPSVSTMGSSAPVFSRPQPLQQQVTRNITLPNNSGGISSVPPIPSGALSSAQQPAPSRSVNPLQALSLLQSNGNGGLLGGILGGSQGASGQTAQLPVPFSGSSVNQSGLPSGGMGSLGSLGSLFGGGSPSASGAASGASGFLGNVVPAMGALSLASDIGQGKNDKRSNAQQALSRGVSGASAGSAFGPWGAVIGAGIGILSSFLD